MKHILTLIIVLLGAIVCYSIGFSLGVNIFIFGGVILEIWFWILALRGSRQGAG